MKKIITIIMLLFVAPVLKAQDTTTLSYTKVYNDLKTLGINSSTRIDSVLTEATNIVKSGAENTWTILVNQQRVIGYTYGILLLLSVCTIVFLCRLLRKFYFLSNNIDPNNINKNLTLALLSIILIIGLIIFNSSHIMTITTGIFNPEYGALQQLYLITR